MARADLILLHAPSVYDFRKLSILYGPVSDLVPSSPIFEMYPIGFTSILEYLERHGVNVRIVNLALLMMMDERFDAEKAIASMDPLAFGVDLHWLPHAHGSIEIAKIIKKHHPDKPVIFGGYSSSYYHHEIMEYGCVDYVVRGDSTEHIMLELMKRIRGKEPVDDIPNLTFKRGEEVVCNEITYVPDNIDDLALDYSSIIKATRKYHSVRGFLPFKDWLRYPISAVLTCRGCTCGCVNCGGSAAGLSRVVNRKKPVFRNPALVAKDIINIQHNFRGPIFILGDIMQKDIEYGEEVLKNLARHKIKNHLVFEFFKPWPEEMYKKVAEAVPKFSIEGSIDSHDPIIRKAISKNYSNEDIENSVKAALDAGCERFDLYFMVGLPKQTKESAISSAEYCRHLYEVIGRDKRLMVFTSPLAPFIDPGSPAFENPQRHGYQLLAKTLEEHRERLLLPSWKYVLNYETEWMNRQDIVDATYEAGYLLNEIKRDYKVIGDDYASSTAARIDQARQILMEIDSIMTMTNDESRIDKYAELKKVVDKVSISTVCEKRELKWPHGFQSFNKFNILKTLFSS